MVLHDLNLACRYAHNIVAIRDQKIFAQGKPEEVISCNLVKNVFDMDCQVTSDPLFGTPLCIPYGKGRCIIKEVAEMAMSQSVPDFRSGKEVAEVLQVFDWKDQRESSIDICRSADQSGGDGSISSRGTPTKIGQRR